MKIACPSCKAEYNIEDARIPASGLTMKCPRCTTSFSVRKDGAVTSSTGAVPLPPAPPPGPPPGARAPAPGPPPGARTAPPPGPPPGARTGTPGPSADLPPPPPPPGGDYTSLDAAMFDAAPPGFGPDEVIDMGGELGSALPAPSLDFGSLELESAPDFAHTGSPPPPAAATHAGVQTKDKLEFDPAGAPAPGTPSLGAAVRPMGGSVDEGDLELLDFIDASVPPAASGPVSLDERFHVRRKTGKIFGPFEGPLIVKMLSDGQLLGNEDVSSDGETWKPIGSVPGFAEAIQKLMDAPGSMAGGKSKSDPKVPFGGRMAEVSIVDPDQMVQDDEERPLLARLRALARRRLPVLIGAAAALLLLVAGGALEVFTPYGFLFRKSIMSLGGPRGGAQMVKLLDEARGGLRADTFASVTGTIDKLDQALKLDPESSDAQGLFAYTVFMAQQRFGGQDARLGKAKLYLATLKEDDAEDPMVVRAAAALGLLDGKPAESKAALQALLQKDPKDAEALFLLAHLHLSSSNASEARTAGAYLDRLAPLEPQSARTPHAHGEMLLAIGDEPGAATAFAAALAAEPGHTASAVELARIALETKKDLPEAERLVNLALSAEGAPGLGPIEMSRALTYQAEIKTRTGHPAEAEALFQQAVAKDPTSVPARRYYGKWLLDQNQTDKAIEILAPAREKDPGNTEVASSLALARSRNGKLLEAMKILEELRAKLPQDARVDYLRGLVLLENGKLDEGQKALLAAATKDLTYASPLVELARNFMDAGHLPEAKLQLDAAVARAPTDPEVLAAQGFYQLKVADVDGALASFEKALEAESGYAPAHHGKALVLEARGDLEGARKSYLSALVTGSASARIRMDYGTLLFHLGELEPALVELEAAKKLDSKSARIRSRLGAVQYHAKKIEESIVNIQTALSMDNKNAETFLYLALLYKEKADLPKAIEAGKQAATIDPRDPRIAYELGLILEAANNPVDSLDWFMRAATLDPKHADALEHAARAHNTLNAPSDSIKAYEAALAADPTRTRLLQAIGEAYLQKRDWKKAIAKFQEALKVDPSLVGVYYRLGVALEETGKRADAIKNFEIAIQKEPDNPLPYRSLGFAYKEKNRYSEAVSWFRKYIEKSPNAEDKAEIEDEISTLGM